MSKYFKAIAKCSSELLNDEECDATDDASSNVARTIIVLIKKFQ